MTLTFDQMCAIDAYVSTYNVPAVHSLDDETHIFHFARDDEWWTSPMVLVNRNGNHFTMIDRGETWEHIKTWPDLGKDLPSWAHSNLKRADPVQLIRLCHPGPQGRQRFESLCYLPSKCTRGWRRMVWRQHILGVMHDRQPDTFVLSPDAKLGVTNSPAFKGKPWESNEAARWCMQHLPNLPADYIAPLSSMPTSSGVFQAAKEIEDSKIAADIESNPLFGAFG